MITTVSGQEVYRNVERFGVLTFTESFIMVMSISYYSYAIRAVATQYTQGAA